MLQLPGEKGRYLSWIACLEQETAFTTATIPSNNKKIKEDLQYLQLMEGKEYS